METNQTLAQENPAFLNKKMDSALIYLFSQYRKSYIGESNAKEVYKKPNEVFGIEDQSDMLNLIMRKMYEGNRRKSESTDVLVEYSTCSVGDKTQT
jgi:exportin-7